MEAIVTRIVSLAVPARLLSAVFLVLFAVWSSPHAAPVLTVTEYELLSTKSAKHGLFDFTYRVSVTNSGTSAQAVSATLVSPPSGVVVVDGTLTFGDVPAGATVISQDTFTIRQTKKDRLDPATLEWIIEAAPANTAPIADAGPNQLVHVGATVLLDGSASADADGDALAYAWSLVSRPAGSLASLSSPTSSGPTFVPDRPGSYELQLLVNDGMTSSAPDFVTITTQNRPPVANAGADQTAAVQTPVQLDGTRSSDPDGDQIAFAWSFVSKPNGSVAVLSDATAVAPTFVVDLPGTFVVQLLVNDGALSSVADTVQIDTSNSPPVAVAGPNQTTVLGAAVHLDGSGSSDIDGDALTFAWTIVSAPAGSTAALSNATSPTPTFAADRPGEYVVRLVVHDGTTFSEPAFVTITTTNSPPVANAGPNQTAVVTASVQLDGSGSTDVDGDQLTYAWSFTTRPAGSQAVLFDATSASPSFVLDRAGTYVVQLVVNDGQVDSAPATVTVTTQNSAPVANAGPDQTLLVGASVVLDASGSTDADGDALTYTWSLIARPTGSTATIANGGNVLASFTIDRPGAYVAQLVVNDGTVNSVPDTVSISTINSRPVANAGPAQSVSQGDTVQLDGSASSDADGDQLTYSWAILSRPGGSEAALSDAADVDPTFTADVAGAYVVQLIVNDGTFSSDPVTVSITASGPAIVPIADAGIDQILSVGATAFLNGTASISPGGRPLTYSWSFVSLPSGSTAQLSSASAPTPTFVADRVGAYVVQLIVNNGLYDSAPDVVVVGTPRQLSLSPRSLAIASGGSAAMTLSASYAGATDFQVLLSSSNTAVATVPAIVTIPAGQTSVTFDVTAQSTNGGALILAGAGSQSATAIVAVGSRLVEWVVDASGFWDQGVNWTNGIAPGPGDVVVIDRPAGEFVITVRTTTAAVNSLFATERLDVVGTLVVNGTAAIDGDLFLAGSLAGTGAALLGSDMTWQSGTIGLTGGLDVGNGQTVTLPNGSGLHVLANTSLRNHGTVAMGSGNSLSLLGGGTVTVTNESDGLWTSTDSPITSNGAGTLTFVNAGTLRKSGASPMTLGGYVAYTNTGTIDVQGGTLRVAGDGAAATLLNSGHLAVASGATFNLDHVTLAAGTTFSGAGTLAMNGTTTVTAAIALTLPTVLTGSLAGSGTIIVDTTMTWQGGTIALVGGLEVLSGRTLTLPSTGASRGLAGTSLRNHGTLAMGGGITLLLQGGTTVSILNAADGLWTLEAGTSAITSNGAPSVPGGFSVTNAGTLQGAGSSVTTLVIGSSVSFSAGTVTGVLVIH